MNQNPTRNKTVKEKINNILIQVIIVNLTRKSNVIQIRKVIKLKFQIPKIHRLYEQFFKSSKFQKHSKLRMYNTLTLLTHLYRSKD